MFDQLWEESPRVQRMRESMREQYREQFRQEGLQEGLQEGCQEGLQEGELLALQRMLVHVVRAKYPDLEEFALRQAGHFDKPDVLDLLILQVMRAPNASTVRGLLESEVEM